MATASLKPAGAPLQGLTGLYGDPQDTVDMMDEGVLEAKANALHPDHGEYGSQAYGYSGTVPDASPFAGMDTYDAGMSGTEYAMLGYDAPGRPDDLTPGTEHNAPWPRGIKQQWWGNPDDGIADDGYVAAGTAMREVHGADVGGPEFYVNTAIADNLAGTDWTADRYDSPDDIMLTAAPGQLKSVSSQSNTGRGAGAADVVQGYGVNNSMSEFAHGHSMRFVQHDRFPTDYTNTHGEQDVPFMGRHPIQQMPFSGPDSPYFEMGDIDGANIPWEGRMSDPSPYVQPAEPTIAPATESQDVWAYA
jgi:hypothetical protein